MKQALDPFPEKPRPMDISPKHSRRRFAAGSAAALATIAFVRAPARAATWAYRYASNLSVDHPLNVSIHQCWEAVRRETGGWKWPAIQFAGFFVIAYALSFVAVRLLAGV